MTRRTDAPADPVQAPGPEPRRPRARKPKDQDEHPKAMAWCLSEAAAALGIDRGTLKNRVKEFDLPFVAIEGRGRVRLFLLRHLLDVCALHNTPKSIRECWTNRLEGVWSREIFLWQHGRVDQADLRELGR